MKQEVDGPILQYPASDSDGPSPVNANQNWVHDKKHVILTHFFFKQYRIYVYL